MLQQTSRFSLEGIAVEFLQKLESPMRQCQLVLLLERGLQRRVERLPDQGDIYGPALEAQVHHLHVQPHVALVEADRLSQNLQSLRVVVADLCSDAVSSGT